MPADAFHWLDVDIIGEKLHEAHPTRDPLSVRFVELRRMIEALPGFHAQPGHPVNEKILETVQQRWHEEFADAPRDDEDEEMQDD